MEHYLDAFNYLTGGAASVVWMGKNPNVYYSKPNSYEWEVHICYMQKFLLNFN